MNANTNGSAAAQMVAVEFDTRKSYLEDIDDNNVGLDVNSFTPLSSFPLEIMGLNLSSRSSGEMIVTFATFVSIATSPIKMSDYLPENMYVGFLASSGTQINTVKLWQFTIDDMEEENSRSTNLLGIWVTILVVVVLLCGFTCFLYRKRCLEKGPKERCSPENRRKYWRIQHGTLHVLTESPEVCN